MKIYKYILLCILCFLIAEVCRSSEPPVNQFECGHIHQSGILQPSTPFEGWDKPNRTDTIGGIALPGNAHFPVLIVFVQFPNDSTDPRGTWPMNSAPVYLDNLISREKKSTGNWWELYNPDTEMFSSHWIEVSRGRFHVISPVPDTLESEAFSVVLPKTAQQYFVDVSYDKRRADSAIHADIWSGIRLQGLNDWRPFDRWKKVGTQFQFSDIGQSDGIVDMIYKVMKSRGAWVQDSLGNWTTIFNDNAGWATLGSNYFEPAVVDSFGTQVLYNGGIDGSGVTVSFRGQISQYIGALGHEHSHYMFSPDHSTYSRVSYGFGYDNFSPADMILNGYMSPTNVSFNSVNNLGDYSSRSSGNGNLLKVPIQNNEYFLLASRNKYSKWDRVMFGDTAQIDMYGDESDYGKGLYIYHVPDGINFPFGDISQQDMECADGLFEWQYVGQAAQQVIHDCFISGSTDWPYYKKKRVSYENDSSNLFRNCINDPGYTPRAIGDGISLRYYVGCVNSNPVLHVKWWGVGDPPSNSCNIGTDRLFTNDEDIYTRFDIGGDREDAWKPGFNEVFSPYSSPNTNTWENQSSGIFIWYYTYSGSGPGGTASLKIYKAGTGEPISLDSALHLTPPSRPMGLVIMPCDS